MSLSASTTRAATILATTLLWLQGASAQTLDDLHVYLLPSLGGQQSLGSAINASGMTAGNSDTKGNASNIATWWSAGGAASAFVPATGVGQTSGAWALNDLGHAAGYANGGAALFANGRATPLPGLGPTARTEAYGINNHDQVVGGSEDADGRLDSVLWNGTVPTRLVGPAGTTAAGALDINDNGRIVGNVDSGGSMRGVVWDGATSPTLLPTLPGGSFTTAIGLNEAGDIAGSSNTGAGSTPHAVVWMHDGGMIDLAAASGRGSQARALNDRGQVVGFGYVPSSFIPEHAMLWQDGNEIDLNSFMSASLRDAGWILTIALGINDAGSVVGWARNFREGGYRGFLLSPIPEPGTAGLLALGAVVAIGAARRRRRA